MGKKTGGFQGLGLDDQLLKGVLGMYAQPTPVQRASLPPALEGRDVACMARTGAGKTAAFLIPLLQHVVRNRRKDEPPSATVLSPTRELALQSYKFSTKMAKFCKGLDGEPFSQTLLVGGESIEGQFNALAKRPAVLHATPGRLAHLLEEAPQSLITLGSCKLTVFDEADRLFEMGFALQLQQLLRAMAPSRQTLLFSATMPRALAQFARAGLKDDVALIRLDQETKLSDTLRVAFFLTRPRDKVAAFCATLKLTVPDPSKLTIVFVATRHHAELLLALCRVVFPDRKAHAIYGTLDQQARTDHLKSFRKGETPLLLVTDVAARGLDVPLVDAVINYDAPAAARLFVHRCGRAARQGRPGLAATLVEPDELPYIVDLHRFLDREATDDSPPYAVKDWTPSQVHYGQIPREVLDGELETMERAKKEDSSLPALERVASNASQQYKRTRPSASKKAGQGAKLLRTTEVHPLFATGASDLLKKAISGYRPPQSILELKAKDKDLETNAGADFRATIERKKASDKIKRENAQAALEASAPAEEEVEETEVQPQFAPQKKRLSKAERKALKTGQAPRKTVKPDKKTSYKDPTYISYGDARQEEMDHLLNDAKRDDSAAGAGLQMLEEALLDVAPDEALAMLKKRSMHKWDARKKKYVQQSVAELIDTRGNKKQKNESGAVVRKKEAARGELYRKWREKKGSDGDKVDYRTKGKGRKKPRGGSGGGDKAVARPVKDEVRNAQQVAKHRRGKRDLAQKNLPKAKRRALEQKK